MARYASQTDVIVPQKTKALRQSEQQHQQQKQQQQHQTKYPKSVQHQLTTIKRRAFSLSRIAFDGGSKVLRYTISPNQSNLSRRTELNIMHFFDLGPTASIAGEQASCTAVHGSTPGIAHIEFAPNQTQPVERNVAQAIAQNVAAQKFFFGIEVSASRIGNVDCLDFTRFSNLLPLFTSIVWLGNLNWNVEPIECVAALKLADRLSERMNVVSHFSAYRLSSERLAKFLALGRHNILAIRGDSLDENQTYKYCCDLVSDVRRLRGDTISIAVAGYPDMHPSAESRKQDIEILAKKVDAGADYIITQICFSSQKLIDFVRDCRSAGINLPIMVGIIIPQSIRTIEMIDKVAHVPFDKTELASIKEFSQRKLRAYFVERAASQIIDVMAANISIYGFQFYSLNRLDAVHEVLEQLRKKGIIDGGDSGGASGDDVNTQ